MLAQAHHPLRAFGIEPIEVGRRVLQRGGLCTGRAVDEGDVGLRLGVVLDRDAFIARQRADHDLDLVLLDCLACRVHRFVGRRVRRHLDELDLLAAGHAVLFLQRQVGTAHAVLPGCRERAFERGQQADLQDLLRLGHAREAGHGQRRCGTDEAAREYLLVLLLNRHVSLLLWFSNAASAAAGDLDPTDDCAGVATSPASRRVRTGRSRGRPRRSQD